MSMMADFWKIRFFFGWLQILFSGKEPGTFRLKGKLETERDLTLMAKNEALYIVKWKCVDGSTGTLAIPYLKIGAQAVADHYNELMKGAAEYWIEEVIDESG